jgi:hypothetical protein
VIEARFVAELEELKKRVGRMSATTVLPSMQSGWGYIVGNASSTTALSQAVTFPVAFEVTPKVFVCPLGAKSTPAPTMISELTSTGNCAGAAYAPTTTGFTARLSQTLGYTFSASVYYGYAWVAIA